jgi:hypothetical protein
LLVSGSASVNPGSPYLVPRIEAAVRVLRAAAGFVNAADVPAAAVDGVVLAFFVDAGAEAAGAELESLGISIRPL